MGNHDFWQSVASSWGFLFDLDRLGRAGGKETSGGCLLEKQVFPVLLCIFCMQVGGILVPFFPHSYDKGGET